MAQTLVAWLVLGPDGTKSDLISTKRVELDLIVRSPWKNYKAVEPFARHTSHSLKS